MGKAFDIADALRDLVRELEYEAQDGIDELADLRDEIKALKYKLKAVGVVCRNYKGDGYNRIAQIVGNPYPKYPRVS